MLIRDQTRGKRRVVIVDDSLTMSALLGTAFEAHGAFDVVGIARDVPTALTMIRDRKPDLVTIDLCMPYIDGAQLLNETAELDGVCKIVVSDTVGSNPRVATTLEQSGAAACISKRMLVQDRRAFFTNILTTADRFERARLRGRLPVASAPSAIELRRDFPLPVDETRRLELLRGKRLLSPERERSFDLLASHVARTMSFPIALVSFVDRDRLWIKASHGIEATSAPREQAFCAHALVQDQPLIVRDARRDPRFADNALVRSEPGIRTYAGQAIVAGDGTRLGALCVIDTRVRVVSNDQLATLRELALLAGEMIDQRSAMN